MKVGDKVKVDRIGGFYSTYKDWAEIVGAERWVKNKYPESMEFAIKAIAPHLTESITLYLLSNDEGDFIFDGIDSNITTVKPHTRTEYEKVTESIFDLRDEFERGELYFKCSEGDWVQAVHESEVVHFLNNCALYRKIEKEIDWRDEVMKYLFENDYHNSRIETNDWVEIKQSFKNDEFLEMCRVALRANGEIE